LGCCGGLGGASWSTDFDFSTFGVEGLGRSGFSFSEFAFLRRFFPDWACFASCLLRSKSLVFSGIRTVFDFFPPAQHARFGVFLVFEKMGLAFFSMIMGFFGVDFLPIRGRGVRAIATWVGSDELVNGFRFLHVSGSHGRLERA
jgi:hypothetical protein